MTRTDTGVGVRPQDFGMGDRLYPSIPSWKALSVEGLAKMYVPGSHQFVQTVRGVSGVNGPRLAPEGTNLRYAAIVSLGLSRMDEGAQRQVLAGDTVQRLSSAVSAQAATHPDPGAVALATWAAAEVEGRFDATLVDRLVRWLEDGGPLPTVAVAWMLTAALAAGALGDTAPIVRGARRRLLGEQGAQGIFPHRLPAGSLSRLRAHVGCFADQVYPIQALARLAASTGDAAALAAADRCADRICRLQGNAGQWWWHYNARDGSVIENYPVYSVHQHAMAPMALFDLAAAGGQDHTGEIDLGLRWLVTHPETLGELVDSKHSVIWRKVGRREPRKAARRLNAVTTAARPGLRLPGLDRLFPVGLIDHECRPYELGWLLYVWAGRDSDRVSFNEDNVKGAINGRIRH